MLINEVIQQVDLSKRAVKYYEEQGLLRVAKDGNGYRNYTEVNILTLKEISIYRKLGISIQDIKTLLHSKDKALLEQIYNDKFQSHQSEQEELDALYSFIRNHDADAVNQIIDYKTIAQALQDMVPGFYGYYFMNHFLPYLQIQITTPEQQQAYKNIIEFWDNADIKIPLFIKCISYFMYRFTPKSSIKQMVSRMEHQLQQYLHPTEEEYAKLRDQTKKNVKLKNSFLYKYHPAFISQRRYMRNLQDQGYNDIFIPNMIALSPKYKEYHDALMDINNRICKDLGLYYDSKYNLIMKKKAESQSK
ncbi:MAG: hypothetical protein RHS_4532 [Robinsoniella sp. RHS]|uniref:MerR family transcriptional regulator n=1 Tax=Robinsoniella sp. RHS TaxID=1504536 RepID=UPI000649CEBF|nr:MAG: hypothetical protein RHS_4532 [Robinsoniella sp. RHS]